MRPRHPPAIGQGVLRGRQVTIRQPDCRTALAMAEAEKTDDGYRRAGGMNAALVAGCLWRWGRPLFPDAGAAMAALTPDELADLALQCQAAIERAAMPPEARNPAFSEADYRRMGRMKRGQDG